jgi:hypothetical protein
MKKSVHCLVLVLFTVLMAAWFMACGGGGGSGGSGGGSGGGTASAATNTIDADDVDTIMKSIDDLDIGCTTSGVNMASSLAISSLRALGEETFDGIQSAFVARKANGDRGAIENPDPIVLNGTCGGAPGVLTIDIVSYNDVTGDFSGTLVFDNMCLDLNGVDEAAIDGGLQYSGRIDDDLTSISLSASTTGSGIIISGGGYNAAIVLNGFSLSFNEASNGSASASVSWTALSVDVQSSSGSDFIDSSNVAFTLSIASSGAMTLTASGSFSNGEGSMLVSTPTPVTLDASGAITGGMLQITGANNTGVRITYAGSGYAFDVAADTNGDGSYDDYNGEMDCDELGADINDQLE